jgi:hypothetical protein
MKFPLIFLFLLLLVLTPMTLAQPPPTTSIVISVDLGGRRIIKKQIIFEQNRAFHFHFHAFNITDGIRLDNTTTNCTFELFDNRGNHLIDNAILGFEIDEFEINVLAGNFSRLGDYHYLVDCETTDGFGGFVSQALIVTANGFEPEPFPAQFSIILFSFLLIAAGLVKERYRLFQYMGSILILIMGVLTLYPGYSFINWTTLTGLSLGTILLGVGFYFLLEPAFSREEQEEHFEPEQGGGG